MNANDIPAAEKEREVVYLGGRAYPVLSRHLVESTRIDEHGKVVPYTYVAESIAWDKPEPVTPVPARKGDHLARFRATGATSEQHDRIVTWLRSNPHRAFTRQELAERIGMGINVVCARVNELIKAERVARAGSQRCSITGQSVEGVTLA